MFKRIGFCRKCGRCCWSFNLLVGAMSDFKKAQEKYGLRLILNPDGESYSCSMLDEKTNLCKIHFDKPKACQDAPLVNFPKEWNCGYKFVYINTEKKAIKKTRKALDFFRNLRAGNKVDAHTKQILEYGRRDYEGSSHK